MGTHTCVVSRAGTNASDTSTAVPFAWQVGPGTGSNPINATDFPGNAYPSGTGTVAIGAPSATITFPSNPDTTFEPDETGVLTVTTTQSGVTITGSPQPFTITNDDADPGSGTSTLTFVYGPLDNAADSGVQSLQSKQQQCGRTWRPAAPSWKSIMGQNLGGPAATGLYVLMEDGAKNLTYAPYVDTQVISARKVVVPYTGAAPSAAEPYTYLRIKPDLSVVYYCATTQPTATSASGANERVLVTIPAAIWDDATFWGNQTVADRVPDPFAQANAHEVVANGIYAARVGAVQ